MGVHTRHRPVHPIAVRPIAVLIASAALLGACSDDDDVTGTVATDPSTAPADVTSPDGSADEVAMQPATIVADAQQTDGSTLTVRVVELPAAGFVAVHADGDGSPGPVIGVSGLVPAGESAQLTIVLSEPLTASATLYPMVHIDTDGNGIYEFGSVEGVDGPGLTADGDVAVVPVEVTVAGAETDGDAAGDGNTITIADFAFEGVTEVAVGTTVVVTNDDASPHTWTSVDGAFSSGQLAQGDSFEFTFTEPGEFAYQCMIHPSMQGTIVVTG